MHKILSDLILPSRSNQRWQYTGLDCYDYCVDKQHFRNYPHQIDYVYNSRGFRDEEWPETPDDLANCVWCIGDSFTVGVGQPYDHIWPQVLSNALGRRTINVSLDGASNDWICRRAMQIQREVKPKVMIVMWSYTHRRELQDETLNDEQRRQKTTPDHSWQDLAHWVSLVQHLRAGPGHLVECTIPNFHNITPVYQIWEEVKDKNWPSCPQNETQLKALDKSIIEELDTIHHCYHYLQLLFQVQHLIEKQSIIKVDAVLDYARDGHHFDVLTAEWLVKQLLSQLCPSKTCFRNRSADA